MINTFRNLSDEQKAKYLKEIKKNYGMDAEDISNMSTHNSEFTYVNFARMDTSGRAYLFYFLHSLVGMKPW